MELLQTSGSYATFTERGLLMYINTFIGLDVHGRSVEAFAFNPFAGECSFKSFAYCAADIAEWVNTLEQPSKAVHESFCTGFDLV